MLKSFWLFGINNAECLLGKKSDVIKIQIPFCLNLTFLGLFVHLFISFDIFLVKTAT